MQPISLLMVGVGGYAGVYLKELFQNPRGSRFTVVGAVDPYASASPWYAELQARNIPIYDTVEAFYAEHTAQMAIVVTPIYLHAQQAEYCMAHGSDVLCEKPLCASLADAAAMIAARDRTGRKLAVGFQWSFSAAILALKQDILAGRFGKLRRLRTIVFFPRNLDYYHRGSGWAGKRYAKNGAPLLDSVTANATAHYLHNLLFLTGPQLDRAAQPAEFSAEIYRANPIEMFDTCAMRVRTPDGAELLYYATHAVPMNECYGPIFTVEGEAGTAAMGYDANGRETLTADFADGTHKDYGEPDADNIRKLHVFADAVANNAPLPCVAETALPHLELICALAQLYPETPVFPQADVAFSEEAKQYTVRGLGDALKRCYAEGKLPHELGLSWAQPPRGGRIGERGDLQ